MILFRLLCVKLLTFFILCVKLLNLFILFVKFLTLFISNCFCFIFRLYQLMIIYFIQFSNDL